MHRFMPVLALILGLFQIISPLQAQENSLVKEDIVVGEGAEATPHSQLTVHYTGWLYDGTKFDSSLDRGQPFEFTLGAGQVIPGWDQGMEGMRVGGKRVLTIPPEMGYGPRGAGGVIPPNATLKFEVELIAVAPAPYGMISADELTGLRDGGAKLVDIRRAAQWTETGLIEGAVPITAFDERRQFLRSFIDPFKAVAGQEDRVVLIGESGEGATVLAHALATQVGYADVLVLKGGMAGWVAGGGATIAVPQ